jgi:hypothetical protein
VGDGFGQFDRTVHAGDRSLLRGRLANRPACRASGLALAFRSHFPRGPLLNFPAKPLAEFRCHPLDGAEVRRLVEVTRLGHLLKIEFSKFSQKSPLFSFPSLLAGIHASPPNDLTPPRNQFCRPNLPKKPKSSY